MEPQLKILRKLTTVGKNLGVSLPKEFVETYGLKKGDLVEVVVTIIKKEERKN